MRAHMVSIPVNWMAVCLLLLPHAIPAAMSPTHSTAASCCVEYLQNTSFTGGIYLPGSHGFFNATLIDNRRVTASRVPALVAAPRSAHDVALSLQAAQHCQVPFAVLSGGHSAAGYCLQEGALVLNMRSMNTTRFVANRTSQSPGKSATDVQSLSDLLYVETGARWREVYEFVLKSGSSLLPVGGGCPQVGVGGFTLGGGWSFLSRSYGLACDNVASMTIVLANGSVVTANSESQHGVEADLFWAMCGGGGGNFGVVTAFVLRLRQAFNVSAQVPQPPSHSLQQQRSPLLLVGQLCWPAFSPSVPLIMQQYLDAWSSTPLWMDLVPSWLPLGDNHTVVFCITVVCNNGQEACDDVVAPVLKAAQTPPLLDTVVYQSYLGWEAHHSSVTDAQEGFLYLTSGVLELGTLDVNLTAMLEQWLQRAPSPRNLILLHVGGGAIRDVLPNSTAFPYRHAQFIIQIKAIWSDPADTAANMQWVRDIRDFLLPYLVGSYVNYIDPEFPGWEEAYYSSNYERLQQLKAAVDPHNFFHFAQSIRPPSYGTASQL